MEENEKGKTDRAKRKLAKALNTFIEEVAKNHVAASAAELDAMVRETQIVVGFNLYDTSEREKEVADVPTCDLVDELKRREGVEHVDISPYANATTTAEGPAILLIVTD